MSTHTHTPSLGMLCLVVISLLFASTGFTQDGSTHTSSPAVTDQDSPTAIFTLNTDGNSAKDYVTSATFLTLNRSKLRRIMQNRPQTMTLELPTQSGQVLKVLLEQHDVLTETYTVHTSSDDVVDYEPGLYYKGTVDKGDKYTAAFSFFPDMVMGVLTIDDHHYVLGHLNQDKYPVGDEYILYDETALRIQNETSCMTDELPGFNDFIDPDDLVGDPQSSPMNACRIVPVYFECDYKMYQDRGSNTTNVMNFLTGLFNVVTTLYQNEGVNVRISDTKIWNTPDPYPYSSSSAALNAFRSRLNGSFDGALAHLLSTRSAGNGGIAYVDVLCAPAYAVAYSNINNTYSNFPTYSWTVNVVAHEMGHNLGSPHTHSCSWSGGALDNCFTPEGACGRGPAPTNGGTIMSYCHLTGNGVNFNNGFGEQPGNLIRNRVNAATCLPTIEGNCDGEGGDAGSPNLTKFSDNLDIAGRNITINLRVRNLGDGGSRPCRIGFYLSEDNSFSTNDELIDTKDLDALAAGETSATLGFPISIDDITDVSEGSYYIGYIIDYLGEVNETNETDNTWYWPSQQVEINGDPLGYCDSKGGDVTYEWIANVSIGSINNTTGRNGGYGDFSNLTTDLPIGESTQLNLTPGHSSQPYAEQWRVWIDLNRDGDFLDANELVFSSPVATTDPVNTPISIPGSASPGITRMRVSMKWLEEDNQLQTSCSTFGFGEVEDYSLNLTGEGGGGSAECFINGVSTAERFDCEATTNTYTQRLSINYTGSPDVIKIQAGTQTYNFSASGSPQVVELTELEATGNAVDVNISLSSNEGCTDSRNFFALFIAARPCEPDDCNVPTLLGAEELNGNKVRVIWDEVPGARFYQLQYREAGDADWTTRNVQNGTSYDINGIGSNATLEYRVRAECNTVGWSDWSEVFIYITTGNCLSPQPYGVEIISSTEVVLKWYSVAGAQKYRIRYRVAGTTAWTGDVEVNGVTFLNLNNLQEGKAYEYQLRSRCGGGWSGWSAIYMFMATSGLAPMTGHQLVQSELIEVQVAPNPSSDYINVNVPNKVMKMIQISDMNGRPMKQLYVPAHNSTIDIMQLPHGMYILDVILEEGQRTTKRFIKSD